MREHRRWAGGGSGVDREWAGVVPGTYSTELTHGSEERRVGLVYKVVELGMVSDEEIEKALNEWTAQGWTFDNMQFAMRDSSKRPAMAFISFTRLEDEPAEG